MNPYKENKNGNIIRRTFSKDVHSEELVWHRDKSDRIVLVLEETDWMVQFDDELPKKLNVNEEYFIPKNTFHRVIKGSNDLVVEIIETEFEPDEYEIVEMYDILGEAKNKKKKKKKDACYYKVKSRYSVWPSAYSSGSLVKCRKVGAKNWGNKTDENKDNLEEKWSEKYKKSIDCNNPKGFSQRAHCQGRKKSNESIDEAKKTDFSKEKEQGLHGWFARQGGKGKSKGWVDCNTCRKDPETGRKKCKTCGRKEGEQRAKYPACRPTPSACSTRGKGKKWGKKSKTKTNENLNIIVKKSIFEENLFKNIIKETFKQEDDMKNEPLVKPQPTVVPKEPDKKPSRREIFKPIRETKPKPKAQND